MIRNRDIVDDSEQVGAIVGGEVLDWSASKSKRVNCVYRITKK